MSIDLASDKFLKKLGLRLREIRLSKGWTLEQVEEHGWPSWRHLQKIEAGKNVTIVTLWKLAKIYKINLSDLFIIVN
jgi:transcriptional regulator with XRE-family HTH domain